MEDANLLVYLKTLMDEVKDIKATMTESITAAVKRELVKFKTDIEMLINQRTNSLEKTMNENIQDVDERMNVLTVRIEKLENVSDNEI